MSDKSAKRAEVLGANSQASNFPKTHEFSENSAVLEKLANSSNFSKTPSFGEIPAAADAAASASSAKSAQQPASKLAISSANRSSIFYTITFIFVLASVSIAVAFTWLIQFDKSNYTAELNAKYSYLANLKLQEISGSIAPEEFERKQAKFKLQNVPESDISAVLDGALVLAEDSNQIGTSRILVYNDANYLYISVGDSEWLYLDRSFNSYRYISVKITLAIVLIVLLLSYVFVLSKLRPLRALRRQIDRFAAGDYSSIENTAIGNDEISQVADAFYEAINKIKDMNQSRQFFLRNIMHELKTPITKGRITAEMLADGKFKDRLIGVFERMVILIDELAAVEQITSGIGKNIKRVSINHVFDEAVQMLLLERECIEINCPLNFSVKVDYKLFSTAVKNMLDNALKYSSNAAVRVNISADAIEFCNTGAPLDKPLSYYIEPFTQGGSRASNSFGLGLYVVHTILAAHKLALSYEHKDGQNVFSFVNINKIKV